MKQEMTRRGFLKRAAGTAVVSLVAESGILRPDAAVAAATQRPISDFLGAQGTTTNFWPPVPDYVGWSVSGKPPFALVDYAGVANAWLSDNGGPDLGTAMSGSITERPLKDGRAEVSVILHTTDALSFVCPVDQLEVSPPEDRTLWFGNLAPAVADGAPPALGRSQLQVVFTNTAPGAPLPDLVVAFILGEAADGVELRQLSFRSTSTGPLTEAAGLGPDGTPGGCTIVETGLFMTAFKGATADGFPAEIINLRAVGR